MSKRTLLTISTTAGLTGLYWLYALLVTPMFQAPAVTQFEHQVATNVAVPEIPPENERMAREHLPNDDWVAEAKCQFRSGQTLMFAQTFERVGSDAIRFTPFAMIWNKSEDEPTDEPLTVIAESALVSFSGTFDGSDLNPGSPVNGIFEREVRVTGPGGLSIEGRNFIFEKSAMHIRSDHPVRFAYDSHRGYARGGLQVELLAETTTVNTDNDELKIEGVHNVRLLGDVSMNFRFEQDDKPVDVTVQSAGSFEYVLETHIATFQNDVQVRRPTDPGLFDSLRCHLLTLFFEEDKTTLDERAETQLATTEPATTELATTDNVPANTGDQTDEARDATPDKYKLDVGKLRFSRLRAEGRNVILQSQSNRLTARMSELVYDFQNKVVALADGKSVDVRQGNNEMHCPEITMIHVAGGKITSAWCRGAGSLVHRDKLTGELVLEARWQRQLRKYPDPTAELDILELQEHAWIRQPRERTGLAAEMIKLWVEQVDTPSPSTGETLPQESKSLADKNTETENFRPKRLLALTDVAVVSPRLQGETERLEVWFEQGRIAAISTPSGVSPTGDAPSADAGRETRKSRRTLQPAVRVINASDSHAASDGRVATTGVATVSSSDRVTSAGEAGMSTPHLEEPSKPADSTHNKEPITLNADLIRVRVLHAEDEFEPEVAEVWTEGHVDVTQPREPGEEAFHMTGNRLHLKNNGAVNQELRIYGEPAVVRDRGVNIEGHDILLDRGRNLTIIEGAGILQLPVKNDFEGRPLEQPQKLSIRWQEQMRFDGAAGNFFGRVRTELADNLVQCEEMEVRLSRRISFAEDQFQEEDAEIQEITCKYGVEFDSREYEGTKLHGVRKARFEEFTVNALTGAVSGDGIPGWIIFWRRADGRRSTLSASAVAQANRPLQTDVVDWEYTRVDFSGKLVGNLKERHMAFDDRVQIVHGPVSQPLEKIDADDLPDNAGWMRCETLQIAQQPATDSQPESIQLYANKNAELAGKSFHARADSISYDDFKKLFILRSFGTREATLWRQKRPGEKLSRADAQRMEFLPSRNEVRFHRTTGVQAVQ